MDVTLGELVVVCEWSLSSQQGGAKRSLLSNENQQLNSHGALMKQVHICSNKNTFYSGNYSRSRLMSMNVRSQMYAQSWFYLFWGRVGMCVLLFMLVVHLGKAYLLAFIHSAFIHRDK